MDNYEFCAHYASVLCSNPAARILDYGCGAGQIVRHLRRVGYDARGCDIFYDGGSLKEAVSAEYLSAGIIREMPNGIVPYPSGTFDLVITNQVIEHVPDLDQVLAEIHRILRPGGHFLALFPYRGTWREGHCGVPLLHRFPKASAARVWYCALWRAAGFGYHKANKGVVEWSRDFCTWLDDWTHYRTYSQLRRSLNHHFVDVSHRESDWLVARCAGRYAPLAKISPTIQRLIVRKLAGLVITCQKPVGSGGLVAVGRSDP